MSENQKTEAIASNELVKAINSTKEFRHTDQFGSLVSYLTNNLQSILSTREYYFNELQTYRNNYIVNGLYDIIANDVFVDNGSSDFISITIESYPEVEKECAKLFDKLNIENVVMSILPELLHYGSYYLKPVLKAGRGIVDLVDDLDPRSVISVTDSKNSPLMYYVSNTNQNRRIVDGVSSPTQSYQQLGYNDKLSCEYYSISEILCWVCLVGFVKLGIPSRLIQQIRSKTPAPYRKLVPSSLKIKTPQSIVWPVIDKLKEVLLLDKLSVYKDIGSILTPNLIGIPVPDVYDPDQLIAIVQKYDELLNSNVVKLNNTQSLEITMQELASVKVVPIVGDRTTPSVIDVGRGEPNSNLESLNNSLSRLLNSLGIPKELFDGSVESKSNMKTNIRYAKKIKKIQKNIARTLSMMCLLHISQKFPSLNVKYSDIVVNLKNNTNIDELENLESQDLLISSISSIKSLLEDIEPMTENSDYEIDKNVVIENIKDSFASLGSKYSSVFKKKEELASQPINQEDI